LLTGASDGEGLSVLLTGEQRLLVAADAETVIRATTGGVAGLDDLLAVFVGDLPFDEAPVRGMERVGDGTAPGDGTRVLLAGPKGTTIVILLDLDKATPKALLAQDAGGKILLSANYDPFQTVGDGTDLLPTRLEIHVPALDLTVEAKYRDWQPLVPAAGLFTLEPPVGYTTESLEVVVRSIAERLASP
jgi:hypothetical protein